MVLKTFNKGETIISYGDSNPNFHLLKSGNIKITEYSPNKIGGIYEQPARNLKV